MKTTVTEVRPLADGVCIVNGKEVFVPFVWEGEEIELQTFGKRGEAKQIITKSEDRISPICRHYTKCGGCRLQHIKQETYTRFKLDSLKRTLSQKNIDAKLNPLVSFPVASRRRAEFASVSAGKSHWFGFNGLKSKEVIAIKECPLLVPEIANCLADIKDLCSSFTGDVFIVSADNGLDILLTSKREVDFTFRSKLADFCAKTGTVRISWRANTEMLPEILLKIDNPKINIAGLQLLLPSGCFLQATKQGQDTLTDLVLSYLTEDTKIADLFSGIGTFALPLVRKQGGVKVSAFDIFSPAMASLDSLKVKGVKTFSRDLFALPLDSEELAEFDAVVLDPPRAGAEQQVYNLANSNVKKIVYVSCNPATFARDADILIRQGNYKLIEITPVDQFLFSSHMELVGLFISS